MGELPLPSIEDAFDCDPDCPTCLGEGHVCEEHPDRPWHGTVGDDLGCPCQMPGAPCPNVAARHA